MVVVSLKIVGLEAVCSIVFVLDVADLALVRLEVVVSEAMMQN